MTGSYNNYFKMFDRETKTDVVVEADRDSAGTNKPLIPRKPSTSTKRKKNEISVDSLDFSRKILNISCHPTQDVMAATAGANLYFLYGKL